MGYRDDFYEAKNIIGYTGVLTKNPTVYFLSADEYGHITQVHDEWRNVGRETVRSNAKYTFQNDPITKCLDERDCASAHPMHHPSRSPMILVGVGALPPELTHAIMVHPEQKALDRGTKLVVTDENRSRKAHPGQQPTDDERLDVNQAQGILLFYWERNGNPKAVPPDTRLSLLTAAL